MFDSVFFFIKKHIRLFSVQHYERRLSRINRDKPIRTGIPAGDLSGVAPESSSWVNQVPYSRTLHDLGDTDGALEGLGVAQLMVNRSSIFISQSRLDVGIDWILPGFGTVILET